MILQSNDKFDEVAEIDPLDGSYRFFSKKINPELSGAPISGTYSFVDQTFLALYRKNGTLLLRIGNREFELTSDVSSTLTHEAGYRIFRLFDKQDLIAAFKYFPPVNEIPAELDPTAFLEEEDFDFLLFVHHVLTDKDRRGRVYRN